MTEIDRHPDKEEASLDRLRRMRQALAINIGIFALQLAGSVITGSNGLAGEATHELGDTAAHGLDVYGESNPGKAMLARKVAGSLILLGGAYVLGESINDLVNGHADNPGVKAAAIALGGFAGNVAISHRLHGIEDPSINSVGQMRHADSDVLKSGAIALGVAGSALFDQGWMDSAAGILGGGLTIAGNAMPTYAAYRGNTAYFEQGAHHNHSHEDHGHHH